MGKKTICCCRASICTRFIGWIHFAAAFFAIIACSIHLVWIAKAKAAVEQLTQEELSAEKKSKRLSSVRNLEILTAVFLSLVVTYFLMVIVLLVGSYNKNPKMLQAWITYTVFFTCASFILIIAKCIIAPSTLSFAKVLAKVMGLKFNCFCLWVVSFHKNNMEERSIREEANA